MKKDSTLKKLDHVALRAVTGGGKGHGGGWGGGRGGGNNNNNGNVSTGGFLNIFSGNVS